MKRKGRGSAPPDSKEFLGSSGGAPSAQPVGGVVRDSMWAGAVLRVSQEPDRPVPSPSQVVIFLGPPGSGKGTQAARLSAELGVPAISTGEMLRHECRSGSELGLAVQSVLAQGKLVSDDLINEVVAARLARADCKVGCILDGYPRTVAQAQFLDALLVRLGKPLPVVFDFAISSDEVVSRLSRRRQCELCGAITSADPQAGSVDLFCANDGSKLIQRADDQPISIRQRLQIFMQNSQKLVRFYVKREYHRVAADRTPGEVAQDLLSILQVRVPGPILSLEITRTSSAGPA
jgi:adenylate kinase